MKILKDSFFKKESRAKTAVFLKALARLIYSTFQSSNCLGCNIKKSYKENEEIFVYASFKKKQFPLEAIACNLR